MHSEKAYFYNCSLYSNKLVLYKEFLVRSTYAKISEGSRDNLKDNNVKGKLSKGSQRKIQTIINNWISILEAKVKVKEKRNNNLSKYLTFLTLTLSGDQKHDDRYIKRNMLDLFMKNLKNQKGVITYLWVAEAQKNGRIHFHILLDRFIEQKYIQSTWNRIQGKHGYLEEYKKKYKHDNPPSTKIETLKHVRNIAAYLTKYFTKSDSGRLLSGRLWGCSDKLKELKPYTTPLDTEIEELLINLETDNKIKKYHSDHFSMYQSHSFKHVIKHINFHLTEMIKYYSCTFNWLYNSEIEISLRDHLIENNLFQEYKPPERVLEPFQPPPIQDSTQINISFEN